MRSTIDSRLSKSTSFPGGALSLGEFDLSGLSRFEVANGATPLDEGLAVFSRMKPRYVFEFNTKDNDRSFDLTVATKVSRPK